MRFEDNVVYIDMDGVLCDFEQAILHSTHRQMGTPKPTHKLSQKELHSVVAGAGVKFFEDMPEMLGAHRLFNFVFNNFLDVRILSSVNGLPPSEPRKRGKMAWLKRHGIADKVEEVLFTEHSSDKKHYAKAGDILIDDYPKNIQEWENAGGIGILYKNTEDVIQQLQQYV